jgi:hypothetical protein
VPHRIRGLVTLTAIITMSSLAAACTPSEPPVSSPSPTPSVSPATPTPSETEFQRQEREAYEGAEKAYLDFRAEYSREITSTYRPVVTQKMRDTAGGSYLKRYAQFLSQRREQKVRSTSGIEVKVVKRSTYKPGAVTLQTCEDGSKGRLVDKKGKAVGRGSASRLEIEVRLSGARWKVWEGAQQKAVKSCSD